MSDMIYKQDAINALEKLSACEEYGVEVGTDEETYIGKYEAITAISDLPLADRPQGEWIKMPHKEYLPWDCSGEYENPTYDEKDHSVVEWRWHCSKCFYEMSRDGKPSYNFCPNCGANMRKGADNENEIS